LPALVYINEIAIIIICATSHDGLSMVDADLLCLGSIPAAVLKIITMKSMIQNLVYDQRLVDQIKEKKLPEGILYLQLVKGKITMKEYLQSL
jgi:hypothetical protein